MKNLKKDLTTLKLKSKKMANKEIPECIKIPTYWYEDKDGYAVIDRELMWQKFEYQMKRHSLCTKKGYRKAVKELMEKKENEENR